MAHSYAHAHTHEPDDKGRAFLIGVGLNLVFVVVEAVFGVTSRSLALVADAWHNLGDVLGLALAWGAAILARRKPSLRRTYGFRKTTVLASVANAVALLFATGAIAWEAVRRLVTPMRVDPRTVVVVALVGMVVNAASAAPFVSSRERDVNVRAAFLHLASDAALSLGVAASGLVVLATGWTRLDPLVSLALAATILVGTWSLLRHSLDLVLDAVPREVDPTAVRTYLAALPGVREVHDLHIWAMSTTETALTAHLVVDPSAYPARFLGDACHTLHDRFAIEHATLQVETDELPGACRLAPEEAV
jgi:cobalt-zinc-cadmium efflux system protein